MELIPKIVTELKRRGNKTVKSVYINNDKGDLTVFPVGYDGSSVGKEAKSFNIKLEQDWSIEKICDEIEDRLMLKKN